MGQIKYTFRSKSRSLFGIIENGEPMLQHHIRSTELEFMDKTKILPNTSSSILYLILQSVHLFFFCSRYHLLLTLYSLLPYFKVLLSPSWEGKAGLLDLLLWLHYTAHWPLSNIKFYEKDELTPLFY